MAEIARVLRTGVPCYIRFPPGGRAAGADALFKDQDEQTCSVPHRDFPVAVQLDAASTAGLRVQAAHEVRVGMELREAFADQMISTNDERAADRVGGAGEQVNITSSMLC